MEEIKLYKIILSPTFINELNTICDYMITNLKEPQLSKIFYRRIIEKLSSLKIFPERHRQLQIKDIIFRKLFFKNYVIIYQINFKSREVFILHIFHGNQNYLNLI